MMTAMLAHGCNDATIMKSGRHKSKPTNIAYQDELEDQHDDRNGALAFGGSDKQRTLDKRNQKTSKKQKKRSKSAPAALPSVSQMSFSNQAMAAPFFSAGTMGAMNPFAAMNPMATMGGMGSMNPMALQQQQLAGAHAAFPTLGVPTAAALPTTTTNNDSSSSLESSSSEESTNLKDDGESSSDED
jgi:hypothetical protein